MATVRHTTGIDMKAAAQELGVKGGRNGLYALLREMGHFVGKEPRYPLIKQGLFTMQSKSFRRGPVEHPYRVPLVTGNGMVWLREEINKHQAATAA